MRNKGGGASHSQVMTTPLGYTPLLPFADNVLACNQHLNASLSLRVLPR